MKTPKIKMKPYRPDDYTVQEMVELIPNFQRKGSPKFTEENIRDYCRSGRIKANKKGTQWLIPPEEFNRFIVEML
ncbi:MAG: helix-turn-helix domain-containing protein [Sphaerochaeta sp.]|jgi:hypothetical protein|nr:helix-turn-helix domain-containing protein [Sphaerochaeta sp.]